MVDQGPVMVRYLIHGFLVFGRSYTDTNEYGGMKQSDSFNDAQSLFDDEEGNAVGYEEGRSLSREPIECFFNPGADRPKKMDRFKRFWVQWKDNRLGTKSE